MLSHVDPNIQKARYLISNTILKMYYRAKLNETEESKAQYLLYYAAFMKLDKITSYDVEPKILSMLVPRLSNHVIESLCNGTASFNDHLTKEELDKVLTYYRKERMDSYEELNNYYRLLMGLPPYGESKENFIYVDNKPIHELSDLEIFRLKRTKQLDMIVASNPDKPYLFYLDKRIDFRIARQAGKYEILYTPQDLTFAEYRLQLNKERISFLRTFHMDAESRGSDYNEAVEMTSLKMRAFIYYTIETNTIDLSKSEYTADEARDMWKEFGLSLPKNMPSTYRNATTFLLNYLTIYKGTNHVVEFLAEKIFSGLRLYKYMIRRRRKLDLPDNINEHTEPWKVYDVDFILRPYNSTNIPDYGKKGIEDKILTYDEVVDMDPRWRNNIDLKRAIFNNKFSYCDSKYLSLDNYVDLSNLTDNMDVIARIFTENKELLSNVTYEYAGTGIKHNVFNFFIYYLAIFSFVMVRVHHGRIPDSLKHIKKMNGFRIPENLDLFKDEFRWFLTRHGFNDFLNKFPDCLNNNQSFMDLLINLDKAIDILPMFHEMIQSAHNFKEYDYLINLYKSIRIVDTSPNSFDLSSGSIDGMTYVDYLEAHDPELFNRYNYVLRDKTYELLEAEVDGVSIAFDRIIEDNKSPQYSLDNLSNAFNSASIYVNGISKYLLYIIKIFKSYTSDILTEENIYELTAKYNYTMTIDQMKIETHSKMNERFNDSCYDYIKFNSGETKIIDMDTTDCMIVLKTSYGDIIIS